MRSGPVRLSGDYIMYVEYARRWNLLESRVLDLLKESDGRSISPIIIELLITAEDHRYQFHPGVDPIALCRALWHSLVLRKRGGGSTIAMQLVRVITGRYERTLYRKILEILLAVRLSWTVSKDQLPKIYLSVAYFGWQMNGIRQACRRLRMNPEKVDYQDAAALVARLKYPEPRQLSQKRATQISVRSRYILRRFYSRHMRRMSPSKPQDLVDETV